jgi:hypothetical protein
MGELTSKFSRDDVETLIEAMGDWEALGNQEYTLLQMIKGAPLPPEDHEAFEYMQHIKDHFRRREREIMDGRLTRQEKSVFLKAKLMLVRRDLGINKLFEMAAEGPFDAEKMSDWEKPKPVVENETVKAPEEAIKIPVKSSGDVAKRLEMAEFFIKDLGVWGHYEKFLAEKSAS